VTLGRLDGEGVESMGAGVTGGGVPPAEVMKQIVAKTDGNPLFVEELTKAVLETGILVEDGEGYRLEGPLPPLAIPATLQDSLMARLGPPAPGEEVGRIGGAPGTRGPLSLAAGGGWPGRDRVETGTGSTRAGRARVPPWRTARSRLQLQARAGAGCGL